MKDEDKLTLLVLNKMQGTLSARLKREYQVERMRNGHPEIVTVEIFDKRRRCRTREAILLHRDCW